MVISALKSAARGVKTAIQSLRNREGGWRLLTNDQFMIFVNEQTWLGQDPEYFDIWFDSLRRQGNLSRRLEKPFPCYAFPAIQLLERELSSEHRVFEYGSGSSTLWYAQHVAEVVAVEHHPEWHALVAGDAPANVELILQEPMPVAGAGSSSQGDGSDVSGFGSSVLLGASFERYVKAIDDYPDGHFHVVSVDGRARVACLERAVAKVSPGGLLILDNSQRDRYQPTLERLRERFPDVVSYYGNSPFQARPQHTTVIRIPSDSSAD
jgi:hypothetical protein